MAVCLLVVISIMLDLKKVKDKMIKMKTTEQKTTDPQPVNRGGV